MAPFDRSHTSSYTLMPISCHFRDCKALLVTSLTHVSGAIASVQTFTFTLKTELDWTERSSWVELSSFQFRCALGIIECTARRQAMFSLVTCKEITYSILRLCHVTFRVHQWTTIGAHCIDLVPSANVRKQIL